MVTLNPNIAHGCIFVRCTEKDRQQDRLTILVRLPVSTGLPDTSFSRPQDELLSACLSRMATKLSPKTAKGKRDRGAIVAEEIKFKLKLLDGSGEELPSTTTNAIGWFAADSLSLSGLTEISCTHLLKVHVNPPFVDALRITADLPIIGIPLSAHCTLSACTVAECTWTWQRSVDTCDSTHDQWENAGDGVLFTASPTDEGRYLRVCCQPPLPGDAVYSLRCKQPVCAGPQNGAWRWDLLSTPLLAPALRLASYNVLADAYASEDLFSYCAPQFLSSPRRRQLIVQDFLQINADVLGLQECDKGQLAALMPAELLDWSHMYTPKSGGAADGCALFWRRSRFELDSQPFELRLGGDLDNMPRMDSVTTSAVKAHHHTRAVLSSVTTIAQGVILRDLAVEARRLLVVNTHLFYHPSANHIRLLQVYMIISELKRRKLAAEEAGGGPVAVVLLGDLNARKFDEGTKPPQAAYRLIRDGAIFQDDVDWLCSSWCPEEWQSSRNNEAADADICVCCEDRGFVLGYGTCPLCDGLGLKDDRVCDIDDQLLRRELHLPLQLMDPNTHVQNTNFTSFFKNCLDYTLVESGMFRVARLIEMPSLEQLEAETALPSSIFPSDHVPVVIDLEYSSA